MNLRKDHYRIRSLLESKFEKTSGILPRVGCLSAADFDVRLARPRPSGLSLTAGGLLAGAITLKALRPFQEVSPLLSREELCNRRLNFGRLWSTTFENTEQWITWLGGR